MKLIEIKDKYPYLYEAISKMFQIIGVNENEYNNLIIDDENNPFYEKYTWTDKQQDEYSDWLYRFLYDNAIARKELMSMPIRNKKIIDKTIGQFILNYGLKIENK